MRRGRPLGSALAALPAGGTGPPTPACARRSESASAVWADVNAKHDRLKTHSPTGAAEAIYVSRSDVFAGLYLRLLRGYALDAIESLVDRPLSKTQLGRFLGELELAERTRRPAVGLGEDGELTGYAVGRELVVEGEAVALSAFPARS